MTDQNNGLRTQGRRGRGCLGWGCLVVSSLLIVLLLVVGVGVALFLGVPNRLGLVKSPAQELLSGTPDRAAASALKEELVKSGFDARGLDVYVLPIKGEQGNIAYIGLDSSKGFRFGETKSGDPITDLMKRLGASDTAEESRIQRIAVDYKGSDGESVVTLTASTESVSGLADGKVSPEQFLKALDGKVNWNALLQEGF